MKTCRKPLAHNSLLAPSLAAFTVLVVLGHASDAEPRESKTQPAGMARVQLPSPDELTSRLRRLRYSAEVDVDDSVDLETDDTVDPDWPKEIPPWSPDGDASAVLAPNGSVRRCPESRLEIPWWREKAKVSPDSREFDPAAETAYFRLTVWSLTEGGPERTDSLVASIGGRTHVHACRIARAIAPALSEAARAAIAEHSRTGKTVHGTVGDVRIEIDKNGWERRNLTPAASFLTRTLESNFGFLRGPRSLAPIGQPALPYLLRALNDPKQHPRVRVAAAKTLGYFPANLSQMVLVETLDDEDGRVRDEAAEALGHWSDPATLPALVGAAKDANSWQIVFAIGAIVGRGPGLADEAVMAVLIRALGDSRAGVSAARILSDIGPRAKTALPALKSQLQDATGYYRIALATSVSEISGEPDLLVEALIAAICKRDVKSPSEAEFRLRKMGKAAVPALRRLTKDENELVRETAERELQNILSGENVIEPGSPVDD